MRARIRLAVWLFFGTLIAVFILVAICISRIHVSVMAEMPHEFEWVLNSDQIRETAVTYKQDELVYLMWLLKEHSYIVEQESHGVEYADRDRYLISRPFGGYSSLYRAIVIRRIDTVNSMPEGKPPPDIYTASQDEWRAWASQDVAAIYCVGNGEVRGWVRSKYERDLQKVFSRLLWPSIWMALFRYVQLANGRAQMNSWQRI